MTTEPKIDQTLAGARRRMAMQEADLPANLPDVTQPRPTPPAQYQRDLPPISIADAEALPPEEQVFPEPAAHDVTFTRGAARRPQPKIADPLLQWASGLPTTDKRIYAGWLVEAGRDEALDDAMGRADVPTVAIRHGSGSTVTHWALECASLFLIADGIQSIGEMKAAGDRHGVAFGWRVLDGGRAQSQLRCRVLLRELLEIGYSEPLLLTVKGTLTGDLITALTRQYSVLDVAAERRRESGKAPSDLPFYAFSIPLGPGASVVRGSGSATKEITPMVALIPEPVDEAYLLQHWTKRAWVQAIEVLADDTVRWSIEESVRIARGEVQKEDGDA